MSRLCTSSSPTPRHPPAACHPSPAHSPTPPAHPPTQPPNPSTHLRRAPTHLRLATHTGALSQHYSHPDANARVPITSNRVRTAALAGTLWPLHPAPPPPRRTRCPCWPTSSPRRRPRATCSRSSTRHVAGGVLLRGAGCVPPSHSDAVVMCVPPFGQEWGNGGAKKGMRHGRVCRLPPPLPPWQDGLGFVVQP